MPPTNLNLDIPTELIGDFLNLDEIWGAVAIALEDTLETASEVVIRAAGAMHVDASDFDRGMAAGLALARYLDSLRTDGDPPADTQPKRNTIG